MSIRTPLYRFSAVWLAGLLTLVPVLSSAAQDEDDSEDSGRRDRGDREDGARGGREGRGADPDEDSSRQDDRDGEDREGPSGNKQKPGRFAEKNATLDGRHVDVSANLTSCTLTDYRVLGIAFFASIQLGAPCKVRSAGSQLNVEWEEGELRIHDNPNGLLRFEAEDNASVSFQLAEGVDAAEEEPASLRLTAAGLSAGLFLTGGGSMAWDHGSRVNVTDAKGNFLIRSPEEGSRGVRAVEEAIEKKKVGGQVDVLVENGTVVPEILPLDDVRMKVSKRNDSAFRFLVDANLTEGRTFAVNFAPGVFGEGQVAVRYYDVDELNVSTEAAITTADDIADVLEISQGEGPEFWIVQDAAGTHVLVAIPHFSIHVFEVLGVPAQVVPTILYGLVFGFLFASAGAAGMFMGRRREL